MESIDLLIENANEILTLRGPNIARTKQDMNKLHIIHKGSVAIDNGKILDIGQNLDYKAKKTINAKGNIIMPGLIDPHTHLIFAGTREFELDWKLNGLSYIEIKERGGGIGYTVTKTRAASYEELIKTGTNRLDTMLRYGTTTCEAKSGYGLDIDNEEKILEVTNALHKQHTIDIIPTFLGAHAIPQGMKTEDYVDEVINEMIPQIKNKASFCDVFCEEGFFSIDQSRRILTAGLAHGMKPKIHADEIKDTGGGSLAAELNAISAEHLLKISEQGIEDMVSKKVIGVMLPGTPFSLMMDEYAPARRMIDAGVPIAVATDLNPNCYVENMQFMIQLCCFQMNMTPNEAITAATFNAACAIDRQDMIGSIEPGKHADILILSIPTHTMIPYHFGINHVKTVIKNGRKVL
jgi:imidazolonepropionase